MSRRRLLNIFCAVAMIVSLVGSSFSVAAMPPEAPAAMPMSPTDHANVPHYFGPYPNWANSPFTLPDATVTIEGDGSGATAEAIVGAEGVITGINITNPGSGYTQATVTITGAGSGAAATAQVNLSGSVTHINVDTPGAGYTQPTVTLSGGGGTGTLVQVGNMLIERTYATDYEASSPVRVFVVVPTPLPTGSLTEFLSLNQAQAGSSPTPSAGQSFNAYVLRPTGNPNEYNVVFDSGTLTVPALADPNLSEVASYPVGPVAVQAGDVLAFYGAGIPVDINTGADLFSFPAPAAPTQGGTITVGGPDFPLFGQAREYSFAATVLDPSTSTPLVPATAVAYGGVASVELVEGGSGYTMPTVDFDLPDHPDGTPATAHAVMDENGTVTEIIVDDPGSGYSFAPNVVIRDGTIFDPINNGGGGAEALATLAIQSVELETYGEGYVSAPTVTISDPNGSGATATAFVNAGTVTGITLDSGGSGYWDPGVQKFIDQLPGLCDPAGALGPVCPNYQTNPTAKYIPVGVPDTSSPYQNDGSPDVSDTYVIGLVQVRMKFHSDLPAALTRVYVQLETAANAGVSQHYPLVNEMLDGTSVPVLKSDGTQWYGVTPPQYLGPTLVTVKDKAARIVFHNLLPTGEGGDLFLPVDTTMMGSGMAMMDEPYDPLPQPGGTVMDMVRNPMCTDAKTMGDMCFLKNRATLHLHGGNTPWISDGTPHQWVTPAGDDTMWPEGVSVRNVPDMDVCNAADDGCQTFYYTNQQSARLLFYHDHSWGITRLNVYAGEAAGYLITDETEQRLIGSGGALEGLSYGTPLIIQDKTFVPDVDQLAWQDPAWQTERWGGYGNLWYHHVYMPAQNPGDPSGMSAFGRWMYSPWFWPPANAKYGPIANPYYNMDPEGPDGMRGTEDDFTTPLDVPCSLDDPATWQYDEDPFCEPALIPGTPNISAGMEQFNDTPLVNGVAYPTVTLEPKAYRFRVLNAANDRFFNFQWYVGDPNTASSDTNALGEVIGATEVALKADEVAAAQLDPVVFPTPDTAISQPGPEWVQIGTEGGFLPAPVVVDGQQFTTWITDPTRFDVGNVDQHSLLLAPAERADVIVDFSRFAGKTLILYNDAPAAFPARIPSYDYYTGAPDLRPVGAPQILPGYGPNTRTVMQVKIAPLTPEPQFDQPGTTNDRMGRLVAAFRHHADGSGVFESGQHPIIVGQQKYNSAYGSNFVASGWCNSPTNPSARCDGYARINEQGGDMFKFESLTRNPNGSHKQISVKIEPKSIQDETSESSFDEFGRMSAILGVEAVPAVPGLQNNVMLPYMYPTTEIIDVSGVPVADVKVTPISTGDDGTQIWKITHNGVDTHPIHFHAFDVQLLNHVAWDNIITPPDLTELGWKDTIRIAPLRDTYVALRPVIPVLPFEVPNSVRLLSPMHEDGAAIALSSLADVNGLPMIAFAPNGEPVDIYNHMINFGWEYVYHCHILSHEEMDMMRPVSLAYPPLAPDGLTYELLDSNGLTGTLRLTWNDNSISETGFEIQRRTVGATDWETVEQLIPQLSPVNAHDVRTYDVLGHPVTQDLEYRVVALNTVGDTWNYANPALNEIVNGGFPTLTVSSATDPVAVSGSQPPAPEAPLNLAAQAVSATQVDLTWTAGGGIIDGYRLERSTDAGATWPVSFDISDPLATSFSDTSAAAQTTYTYRLFAFNQAGDSPASNLANATTPVPPPAAPSGLTATNAAGPVVNLSWTDNATNEAGFVVERSDNGGAFVQIATPGAFAGTGQTGIVDATVQPLHTYDYRVFAVNAGGQSGLSNVASVTVPAAPAGPNAPTNLVGTLQASLSAGPRIVLTFTDNATNETNLQIWRSVNGGAFSLLFNRPPRAGTGNVSYTDLTVLGGNTYDYYVVAVNAGGASAPSNTVSVAIPPAPAAPSNFNGTTTLTGGGTTARITVTWTDNANNETRFQIQRSTSADFTTGVGTFNPGANITQASWGNLPRGTSYWIRIRAQNAYGSSEWVLLSPFPIITP